MRKRRFVVALILTALLSACLTSPGSSSVLPASGAIVLVTPAGDAAPTYTPFQPLQTDAPATATPQALPSPSAASTLSPTASAAPASLWISPAVPDYLRQLAQATGIPQVSDPGSANVRLDVSAPGEGTATWIYALVSPFPTTIDGVTLADIRTAWQGGSGGPFDGKPFRMDATTLAAFTAIWGAPAPRTVYVLPPDRLIDLTWTERPIWAIVPFEALDPQWKVLTVDGQSPIHKDFDPSSYPLQVSFSYQPASLPLPATNRDPGRLTVLAMTGVTALVRGVAQAMNENGVLYPDANVRDVLRSADVTHISNEVSFDSNCPIPDKYSTSLRFCSDPKNIALLDDVNPKVIELTGNHLLDYGMQDLLTTLDMYTQRGWQYYGGGKNLADAQKYITVVDHGNQLAFLGCNPAGPVSDWATASTPGSAPCDYPAMESTIAVLRASGYLPVVTLQYNEYYTPVPYDYEKTDFRNLAAAGAIIVSGSQAHLPQAMEFYDGAFIHYGLGNLFFDQMLYRFPDGHTTSDVRNEFIDRYVIYDGKLISVELLSYRLENWSQPRPMTPQEREQFLQSIFAASDW